MHARLAGLQPRTLFRWLVITGSGMILFALYGVGNLSSAYGAGAAGRSIAAQQVMISVLLVLALIAFLSAGVIVWITTSHERRSLETIAGIADRLAVGEIITGFEDVHGFNATHRTLLDALQRLNEYHSALENSALRIASGDFGTQIEVASEQDRLARAMVKLAQGITVSQEELHRNNMDMALFLAEYVTIMREMSSGDLAVEVSESNDNELMQQLAVCTNQLIRSLREVAHSANRIAVGDLTTTVALRSDRDEMGRALQLMVQGLHALVLEVKQQAAQLSRAALSIAQITEQSSQMISQLSRTSAQISSSTSSVAQSSQNASVLSQAADGASRQGQELMGKLVEKIRTVKTMEETSGNAMNNLASRSVQIGDIVNVITKIADQTNLLSLNAAIEAARAGEAGHGFAVVADEVRKLAESSAHSAQEISRIIKEVQDETANAVTSVQNGRHEIEEGLALTEQSSERFSVIVRQIDGMAKQIEVIASAAEETAASAQETAASTEEQSAAIEEISSNITNLGDTAKTLQSAIEKFRV